MGRSLSGFSLAATTPLGATWPELLLPDRSTLFELIDDEPGGVEGVGSMGAGDGHGHRDLANLDDT